MSKKIIAVFGATGAQGGGLARAIAADPGSGFVARAITRNPDSDKAKALTCCVELYLSSLAFSHSGSGVFLTQPKGYS